LLMPAFVASSGVLGAFLRPGFSPAIWGCLKRLQSAYPASSGNPGRCVQILVELLPLARLGVFDGLGVRSSSISKMSRK
jgi:hypothetical protein